MNLKSCRCVTTVKTDETLRRSFNELTAKTFGFDFTDWYQAGNWGEMYIPHVMAEQGKVFSNVSVNLMRFESEGVRKNYIQLGTVMTDAAYRGQGLNRRIMEQVLREYEGKADGIYLFANDSVLDYYPKFGFRASREYEYYLTCDRQEGISPYNLEKVDMGAEEQYSRLFALIGDCASDPDMINPNDGLYLKDNLGLYHFWLDGEFADCIFYIPERETYVVAQMEGRSLRIHQLLGRHRVELKRIAGAFGNPEEIVLGYMPADRSELVVREHKEEDTTLFILGEDLKRIEADKMMFPILSHA